MRLLLIFACLALSACAGTYDVPLASAPEPLKATEGAKKGANEEKLVGPVEVSAVRQASPVAPGPYMLCVKGNNTAQQQTYVAVFSKNDDYVASRMSVLSDGCEVETYAQLETAPSPSSTPAPSTQQKPAKRRHPAADRPNRSD
jgi:hypothetical protein